MEEAIELTKLWLPQYAKIEQHEDTLSHHVMFKVTWEYGLLFTLDPLMVDDLTPDDLRTFMERATKPGRVGVSAAMAKDIAKLLGLGDA